MAQQQRAACSGDSTGEGARDVAIVDDPALGNVKRLSRHDVRFDLARLGVAQEPQALKPVRRPAFVQRVQLRQLRVADGNDKLPGEPVRDLVLLREADQ